MWTSEVEENVPLFTVTYGEKHISSFFFFILNKTQKYKIAGK